MTHIHHQPYPVHFSNSLPTKTGKTWIFCLVTTRCQQRLVIIAELHKAHPQLMQDLNEADIIFHW